MLRGRRAWLLALATVGLIEAGLAFLVLSGGEGATPVAKPIEATATPRSRDQFNGGATAAAAISQARSAAVAQCMADLGHPPPADRTRGWGQQYLPHNVLTADQKADAVAFDTCVRAASAADGLPANVYFIP